MSAPTATHDPEVDVAQVSLTRRPATAQPGDDQLVTELHLKTRDSAANITVDAEGRSELNGLMSAPTDKSARWLESIPQRPCMSQPESRWLYHRAEETFHRLNTWLRGKDTGRTNRFTKRVGFAAPQGSPLYST